jgi:holo-[acyl-carrier protein] synthase
MIYGVGLDLCDIKRIEDSLTNTSEGFINRIAHPADREHAPAADAPLARRASYWAGRFASKEAFAKALGTGIGATCSLQDVGVGYLQSGAPQIVVSAKLQEYLNAKGIKHSHISITHAGQMAAAVVFLEC